MKKAIQPADIKLVALDAAFDKEDFDQLILAADAAGDIEVSTGAAAGAVAAYQTITVAADQVGLNVQVDLEGTEQFVQVTGAGVTGVLAGKADVFKVRGNDEPVLAVINDTKYTR